MSGPQHIKRECMDIDMSLLPEDLGALFELERDPVLGIDAGGTIVYANPAAAALFHVRPGDGAGDLVPENILADPASRFVSACQVGDRHYVLIVSHLKDVGIFAFSPLHPTPPAPAIAGAVRDLSDAMMTARMAIDALISRTRAEDDPALQQTTQTLYREYHRMLRSCRHMTMASGILSGDLLYEPRVVDLGVLCRDMCDTVGKLIGDLDLSVTFRMDDGLHLTVADADLLEKLLANLLTNSIAHCTPGDAIRVELSRQGDRFILAVEDPGSGISPEKLADLFSPDPSPREAGAGLGMLLVRGIAERHGGTMILESRPGKGVSVRVSIPYRQSGDMKLNSPKTPYRASGMDTVLTELSVILDKKYYTRKYFD